jgi:hypothetical protein
MKTMEEIRNTHERKPNEMKSRIKDRFISIPQALRM